MDSRYDDWNSPDGPPEGGLSGREREVMRNVWSAMRDWFETSVDALQEENRQRVEADLRGLRLEIDRLIHDERFWGRELEAKLRRLEAFEIEFGSTRTAEESQHLFREVRAQLSARDSRWERILELLDGLAEE